MEALLQIYSCFFSHTIKPYVAYHNQQCYRFAALPAKMSVFSSHLQHSIQLFQINPDCTLKKSMFVQ